MTDVFDGGMKRFVFSFFAAWGLQYVATKPLLAVVKAIRIGWN